MQTGSSGTLIGWKSGQTTFVPLWDRMEGAWLRTQKYKLSNRVACPIVGIESHYPLPRKRVCPLLGRSQKGGATLACG